MLAALAAGCSLRANEPVGPTQNTPPATSTPLPPSPSATPAPSPTSTPTFQLIDSGLLYIVVGIDLDQALPVYLEPSPASGIAGEIPPTGNSIQTTGLETTTEDISWLQIEYQGLGGWVDQSFLATQEGSLPEELIALAHTAAAGLKIADYSRLEGIIHPQICLRFSPYPYLQPSDQTFCPDQLSQLKGTSTLYTWGRYDGSGKPIELTFDDYHQRFVYDQDYYQPEIVGLNQEVSSGNAINNIPEIYPDGLFVEYYFSGFDPQYGGMDWRSLRMVFVQENDVWYLVALVHGEWTI